MGQISTHVLDHDRGGPAAGVTVTLSFEPDDPTAAGPPPAVERAGPDGRIAFPVADRRPAGTWHLDFETGPWLAERGRGCRFPHVSVRFRFDGDRCHVPLYIGEHGYKTYRGS